MAGRADVLGVGGPGLKARVFGRGCFHGLKPVAFSVIPLARDRLCAGVFPVIPLVGDRLRTGVFSVIPLVGDRCARRLKPVPFSAIPLVGVACAQGLKPLLFFASRYGTTEVMP